MAVDQPKYISGPASLIFEENTRAHQQQYRPGFAFFFSICPLRQLGETSGAIPVSNYVTIDAVHSWLYKEFGGPRVVQAVGKRGAPVGTELVRRGGDRDHSSPCRKRRGRETSALDLSCTLILSTSSSRLISSRLRELRGARASVVGHSRHRFWKQPAGIDVASSHRRCDD